MKKKNLWIFIPVFFFALVFMRAMTFVYVDGDDATSLAYHLLGRDAALQPPYSPYQGMADLILGLLPANETVLRLSALVATNLSVIIFVSLLLYLLFTWVRLPAQLPKWLISLALLLALPELSYIGLIYSPTLTAMSFILGAHLLARKSYRDRWLFNKWTFSTSMLYLFSMTLFGVGVSFRWNTLLYGAVIYADLSLLRAKYRQIDLKDFLSGGVLAWGLLALATSFGMVALSGYGIEHFARAFETVRYVFNQSGTLSPGAQTSSLESLLRTVLTLTPEFTPAFVLLGILGFVVLLRRKNPLWLLVLVGILSVLPWLRSGNPKFIITSLPVLALLFVVGLAEVWQWFYMRMWQVAGMLLLFAILLLPWVVGVQVALPDNAWGPGFALQSYAYENAEHVSVSAVLDSGMAFPSPEGPRPLWGHAYVLFGGGWRDLVSRDAAERADALNMARDANIPLVVTSWSPDLFLNLLYADGYYTKVQTWDASDETLFVLRDFHDGHGNVVNIFFAELEADAFDTLLGGLEELSMQTDAVVLVGYPRMLRTLYEYAPDALSEIGAEIALVDLTVLFHRNVAATSIMEPSPMSRTFTTISPTPRDDYLSNPGIGWQYDIHPESAVLPETVAYARRSQVGWSVLNPSEGIYDWAALDAQLSQAVAVGKQFSLRVFTMRGEEYGGHMLPAWVLDDGAALLPSGEPNYSSCVYQEDWATFVEALVARYDGNPDIAFVDISGYGDFNEWSWRDEQTVWSELWDQHYQEGVASSASFRDLDSQARRRLVDMFIGGAFNGHECLDANGALQEVSYAYVGFQKTQLVMPFAGIVQSTQYVFSRDPSIGFRHDCLGRPNTASIPTYFVRELDVIWRQAPIIYEFCTPDQVTWQSAQQQLGNTHGSIVHNNETSFSSAELEDLLRYAGYRYFLREARIQEAALAGENLSVEMDWQNLGSAPNYPAMGQEFTLMLYLEDENERGIERYPVDVNITAWIPATTPADPVPLYSFSAEMPLPNTLQAGTYILKVGIIEKRTGKPIQLAFEGDDGLGKYFLTQFKIEN